MPKPHIVLIGGDGGRSGVPQHITDLVRALRDDARLTVLSEADRGGFAETGRLGASLVALPGLATRLNPRNATQGRSALAGWLRENRAHLVWGHARMPVLYLRQLIRAQTWRPASETRVALTYHGLPFGAGHRMGTGVLGLWMERRLLNLCPPLDLLFLTAGQRDRMQSAVGRAMVKHTAHVLGNASHLGTLTHHTRPPGRHLVMTGRAGWQKNYAAALRLMPHLPPDMTLTLCGAGTETTRFARMIHRLAGPAAHRVQALGPVQDVRPLLAAADGYMLTSRYEGQPIGAIEAMEAGLPVFVTPFEGAADLVEGLPMGSVLQGSGHAQAAEIEQLVSRYCADRVAMAARIRAHWAAHHAPAQFAQAARRLVFDRLLR